MGMLLFGPGGQIGTRRKYRLVVPYPDDQSLFPAEEAGVFPRPIPENQRLIIPSDRSGPRPAISWP